MRELGILPLEDISSMQEGALEYEEAITGMEIMDALQ